MSDWAYEKALWIKSHLDEDGAGHFPESTVAAALRSARNEALEEAARVAGFSTFAEPANGPEQVAHNRACRDVYAGILSLKDGKPNLLASTREAALEHAAVAAATYRHPAMALYAHGEGIAASIRALKDKQP